ncbi:MAG TPA: hypothetical protein ENH28_08245 [Euryarchaeota archaeon]|nr:cobalt-precorrin-8X methylmutase [archaeon BMS3Bbin15]HDL16122.1 hypothetical protein [Euryarchaeota archaeon]
MKEAEEIEKKSFSIIERKLGKIPYPEREVVKRVIHSTADYTFSDLLVFHENAIRQALKLIRNRVKVITDVNMVRAGIKSSSLIESTFCFINNREVIESAEKQGITRARASFRNKAEEIEGSFVVIGNSPTALFELCNLIDKGIKPGFVVASPVGFVGAAESKEEILKRKIPSIAVRGNRGGSSVAVAITNALLILAEREEL